MYIGENASCTGNNTTQAFTYNFDYTQTPDDPEMRKEGIKPYVVCSGVIGLRVDE